MPTSEKIHAFCLYLLSSEQSTGVEVGGVVATPLPAPRIRQSKHSISDVIEHQIMYYKGEDGELKANTKFN